MQSVIGVLLVLCVNFGVLILQVDGIESFSDIDDLAGALSKVSHDATMLF